MGYEYELLKAFADANGLKINIKLAQNVTRLTEMLLAGEGDVVAYPVPVTNKMKQNLIYCGMESLNEQVLVQASTPRDSVLKDVTEMIGKEIWVIKNSKQHHRLINLDDELGGGIVIREIGQDTVTTEDLIGMVSSGKIRYTIANRDIAKLNRTYFKNINIGMKISYLQPSSWAVNKTSPRLAGALDRWFDENKNTANYKAITKRYFEMSKMPGDEPVHISSKNAISPYDSIFRKYAPGIGWDWRLLASISYQESRFDTTRVSWAGAAGLMGLMPRTAKAFGLEPGLRQNPERNIRAATKYIRDLQKTFSSIENKEEQINFVLAAYNAGSSHIFDAQALAKKTGRDTNIWKENVEEGLKLKQHPEYYTDSVCKNGYFRGRETINYVEHVVERWRYYQEKIKQ